MRSLGVLPDLEAVEDAPEVANAEEGDEQVLEDADDDASLLAGLVLGHDTSDDGGDGAEPDRHDEHDEAKGRGFHSEAVSLVDHFHA